MKPYKFAIFDIDGTLTEIKPAILAKSPRMVTPNKLGEQQPMPGVIKKLRELKDRQIEIALATNRGGVAFGFTTFEMAKRLAEEAAELCEITNAAIYVCPYHPSPRGKRANLKYKKDSDCRKPNPGMLLEAMDDAGFGPEDTIFVGDRDSDKLAAHNAGVRFYWANEFFT